MIGHVVSHYRILQKMGGGGMGVVYKAEDLKLRRTVALKFLAPELTRDEDAKKRFLHEAQAASALDHPNICGIHEIDETPEGQLFIAMTCYDGESLKQRIARRRLDVQEAFQIAFAVAQGLGRAHASNIIHRDIKPGNVMITDDGFVKIIDFGLSKLIGRSRVTGSGATLGTAAYMSPEQARSEDVDARVDIWALGAILYEMLTGHVPFRGEIDQAVVYSILNEQPAPIKSIRSDVPDVCASVVMTCLEKDPKDRYQSAEDFCVAVFEVGRKLGWADSFSSAAVRAVSVVRDRGRRSRRAWPVVAIAGIAIFGAGWVGLKGRIGSPYSTQVRLAVVPFERIGEATSQAAADGISHWVSREIERASTTHKSMWVMPYERVLSDRPVSIDRMSDALGVNRVLEGEFQAFEKGTRLTLRLQDADRQTTLRTASIDLNPDFEGLLTQISGAVATLLNTSNGHERPENSPAHEIDPPGMRPFMEGLGYLDRYRHGDSVSQAVRRLEESVAAAPGFAPGRTTLAAALYRQYQREATASLLEAAEQQVEQSLALDSTDATSHAILSLVLRELKQDREAERECRTAIVLAPSTIMPYEALMDLLVDERRYADAIEAGKSLVAHCPDYYRVHWRLGWLYRRLDDPDNDLREHLIASRVAPRNDNVLNSLGVYYYQSGDWLRAREFFERSYIARPSCGSSSNVGALLYYEGRYDDSAKYYRYALEQCDSTDYFNWGNWAASLYWDGKRDEAGRVFEKAVSLATAQLNRDPDDGVTIARLADYYAMMGRADESQKMIAQAARFEDEEVYYRIACAYENMGEREKALDYVGRAVQGKYPLQAIEKEPLFKDLMRDSRFKMIRGPATQ